MGWIEKLKLIKDRIFGTKPKMLNAPEKNENTNITKVDLNMPKTNIDIPKTIEKYKINYQINPNTPESAIEQYLMALLYRRKNNDNINSYGALTDLGGLQDQKNPGKNPENEKIVLNKIRRDRRYSIQEQKSGNGEVDFYHILKGKHEKTVNRLYLNCKRENVAVLANELLKELENTDSYYFKFNSDTQMQKKSRPEKFVFYLSDNPIETRNVITAIERIKQRNPRLFEGSKSVSPFLNTINGNIMYAKEPTSDEYIGIDGRITKIAKSYNSLLAAALNDCYYTSISDIVAKDYYLASKTQGMKYDDSMAYTLFALEDVLEDPFKKKQLIEGMKNKLQICMKNNTVLDIKGMDKTSKKVEGR